MKSLKIKKPSVKVTVKPSKAPKTKPLKMPQPKSMHEMLKGLL